MKNRYPSKKKQFVAAKKSFKLASAALEAMYDARGADLVPYQNLRLALLRVTLGLGQWVETLKEEIK